MLVYYAFIKTSKEQPMDDEQDYQDDNLDFREEIRELSEWEEWAQDDYAQRVRDIKD